MNYSKKRFNEAEKEISTWIKYINNGDIIFDIGTNVGLYAIWLSKKLPNSYIHAFDPMGIFVENSWHENMKEFKINNTKFYNFGFSDVNETKSFLIPKTDLHIASIDQQEVYSYKINYNNGDPVEGNVKRLDLFTQETKIYPDVIKIDAEGAELDIIMGGLDVILNCKTLILEMPYGTQYNYRHYNTIKIHDLLISNKFTHKDTTAKFNRIYTK
jgi:FkbM family methyltransferase